MIKATSTAPDLRAGYIAGLLALLDRFGFGSRPAMNSLFMSEIRLSRKVFSSAWDQGGSVAGIPGRPGLVLCSQIYSSSETGSETGLS
jgi:hypothetical protein